MGERTPEQLCIWDTAELQRTCGWCGQSIAGKRPGAKYCSRQHKRNDGSRRHRERNPGYYKKYKDTPRAIAWREGRRAEAAAYSREYNRRHPEQRKALSKAWREANREYYQIRERNRRAMKLHNPDSVGVSQRDWIRLCRRYNHCCAYCEQPFPGNLQMDHVFPLSKGGRHAIGNILPACGDCNLRKNAAFFIVWRYRKVYRLMGELAVLMQLNDDGVECG